MWQSLIQCAQRESYFARMHLFNRSIFVIRFKWVNHCVLVISSHLISAKSIFIEIVVEWEKGSESLLRLSLIVCSDLLLFELLFLSLNIFRLFNFLFIDDSLEFFDRKFHLFEGLIHIVRGSSKLFDDLFGFLVECIVRIIFILCLNLGDCFFKFLSNLSIN